MKVRLTRAGRAGTVAGVALAAALTLSGCAGQNPDTAATVNGTVITEHDVTAVSRDMASMPTTGPSVTNQDILVTLILRPFVVDAAQRTGTMVSPAEARQLLGDGLPNPSQQTVNFAQTSLISRRLPQAELAKVVQQFRTADVKVNPRYGTLDPQRGLVPTQQNWMTGAGGEEPAQAPVQP